MSRIAGSQRLLCVVGLACLGGLPPLESRRGPSTPGRSLQFEGVVARVLGVELEAAAGYPTERRLLLDEVGERAASL